MANKYKNKSIVELLETLHEKSTKTASVVAIHAHVNGDDPRWDKACEVAWLMSDAGQGEAIKLQLDNLVATYSYSAVRGILDSLNTNIKRGKQ